MLNYTKLEKFLLMLGLAIALASCENNKIELTQEQYKELIGGTIKPIYPKTLEIGNHDNTRRNKFLIELGSDGHDYAHNINAHIDFYVAFHYPDCIKCKKDTL